MCHEHVELSITSDNPVSQLGVTGGLNSCALDLGKVHLTDVGEVVAVSLGAQKVLGPASQAGEDSGQLL